tara:strand:- start:343 stop:1521 length:1179 start_codon:yes stop_codon:yes gene_type:complete
MSSSILPTYNRAPLAFDKGQGSWLFTKDGDRYLDMGAGIAVNALGHSNPELVEALTFQASKLWHVSNLYEIPEQRRLADLLVEASFADNVFFTNSGTESCELAIKMVRKYWYEKGKENKVEIITFEGSFHGRSSAGIAAAGGEKLTKGFGPMLPGFVQLPWYNHDAIEATINEDTAAILIEPIQGEGGIRCLPDECLKSLRILCDKHDILLMVDEVQCGIGRTGKLFAYEWSGIEPDIAMVAKGIGGGFPLGAVLAKEHAASGMTAGTHGSTYGGNPLACSVGIKVLELINTPKFLNSVISKSGIMSQGLLRLIDSYPDIFEEIRGTGLMLGVKCKCPNTDFVKGGYENAILTVPASDNVVRLLPALNITAEEVNEGLSRLEKTAACLREAL